MNELKYAAAYDKYRYLRSKILENCVKLGEYLNHIMIFCFFFC